jgi:hypothetical protein
MTDFLKAEQIGSNKWRVLAIPFGGEFKDGKDADGEFFSLKTDVYGPYKGILAERPVAFHHGGDPQLDGDSVGVQDELELDEKLGWWGRLWLDRSHRYHTEIDALLRAGKMYGSSGSIPQFVRKNRQTGEILVWPHLEQTLTLTPANRRAVITPAKAIADYDSAGLATKSLADILSDLEGPTADLPSDLAQGGGGLVPDLPAAGDLAAKRERLSGDLEALLERLKTI